MCLLKERCDPFFVTKITSKKLCFVGVVKFVLLISFLNRHTVSIPETLVSKPHNRELKQP